jgi:hypothetical protein
MSPALDHELPAKRLHIRGSGPTCASSLGAWVYPSLLWLNTSVCLWSFGLLAVFADESAGKKTQRALADKTNRPPSLHITLRVDLLCTFFSFFGTKLSSVP